MTPHDFPHRGRGLGLLGKVLPFAPAVEVDEGLHAAPFHDFALQPDKVDGLDGEELAR